MSNNEEVETKMGAIEDDDDKCDDDCQFIFPQRLMSILADERNHDAICWLPHGRAFIIRNRKLFAERVMYKFFPRKSKYSSFTRKLNRWNFVRVSSGPELGAYYHEFFLRDKPHLAAQMFCKNARTKIAMASPDPKPTPLLVMNSNAPSNTSIDATVPQLKQQQQPAQSQSAQVVCGSNNQMDAAQMYLMRQQMDPTLQFLLEQQLQLGQQHMLTQLQQQKQEQKLQPMMNMFQGSAVTPSASLAGLQQQVQLQKQQHERMVQLQQLMALNNLKRQQKRKNNFRASAA